MGDYYGALRTMDLGKSSRIIDETKGSRRFKPLLLFLMKKYYYFILTEKR